LERGSVSWKVGWKAVKLVAETDYLSADLKAERSVSVWAARKDHSMAVQTACQTVVSWVWRTAGQTAESWVAMLVD
jgi:hypothetical protein